MPSLIFALPNLTVNVVTKKGCSTRVLFGNVYKKVLVIG